MTGRPKGGGTMAEKKNDSLEEILRKLEAAEKEYAEKLQNSRLEELIQKEEARRGR